jgi:hypothetical protein
VAVRGAVLSVDNGYGRLRSAAAALFHLSCMPMGRRKTCRAIGGLGAFDQSPGTSRSGPLVDPHITTVKRTMVYFSKWEGLSEALARVKATGIGEDAAKRGICNAMADGKIRVRIQRLAEPDWMVHEDVFIPPHLYPDDLCWVWSSWHFDRLNRYGLGLSADLRDGLSLWDAAKIELCREDVIDALRMGLEKTPAKPRALARDESAVSKPVPSKRGRRNPKRERARRAIDEIFPAGVPDQVMLTDKELFRAVGQHLEKLVGNPGPRQVLLSNDTILRAAGRRK